MTENPFFAPSTLPYRLPPFDRITVEHFAPAFERGMAEQRAEVEAIATNPEPPTFANTPEALERSGQLLSRVSAVFFNQSSSNTNDDIAAIEADVSPKLAAHSDAIYLDPRLFARIENLYERRAELDLDPESDWLLERYQTDFVRAGARLTEADRDRLRQLNEELSVLSTRFKDNLLTDTNDSAVVVDDAAELAGLPNDAVAAAAEAARSRGLEGKYLLTLVLPTGQPALESLTNRDLRRRIVEASLVRGARGNEYDNHEVAARMVALRAERARLLGYPDHASYVIEDQTARTTSAVREMLGRLAPAAVANAHKEAEALRAAAADEGGHDGELAAWDWSFYSERVRRERYDVDAAELRPYFELERVVRDGVFYAAGQLYGLRFVERDDLPGYHEDIRVFEVFDANDEPIGLFLGDYYTRDSKRGGAWANSLVRQSRLLDQRPVVVNNLNISKPPEGEPTLLTFSEVKTLFHEFGHALHALFSAVEYPRFSGTSVPRDFVEYPSQVNEMWILWPEVLANYAKHYRTGEPLPDEVVERLRAARRWGEGFATTEYLAASLLDLAWHELGTEEARRAGDSVDTAAEVERFEHAALADAGVALDTIPPRYRTTYFAHIFSSGYSAGYYSYIWSEVLDADTVTWFEENGGLRRENGERFREAILSKGGSVDPMTAFREFRGGEPEIQPLLERRGLTG